MLDRAGILSRKSEDAFLLRQRSGFHQLVVCRRGRGVHHVDFERVDFQVGTVLRIHPGQVQRFVPEPRFEARMLVWPTSSHRVAPDAPTWYPGSDVATVWQVDAALRKRLLGWIDELEDAQSGFVVSANHRALLQSMLTTFLLRLEIELPSPAPRSTGLPAAYLAYRRVIEEHLYRRPSVAELASRIGYSTRTLDRSCQAVSGQTARQVLDARLVLEIRRLLTQTDRAAARIGAELGFDDPSNFSRFVRRHLDMTPSQVRRSL
ncbi:MAG: AraC family transcriptional regulator [Actinomycetota bacterium]